jgi:hypothetical protein
MGTDTHPKERGQKSEAAIRFEFIKRGVPVLEPFGDNERYDLVIEAAGEFHRVQIKTGRMENGRVQLETRSSGTLTRKVRKENYDGEIDVFAIYSPEIEDAFVVPISEAPGTTMGLRVKASEKPSPNINWVEEYTIDKWLTSVRKNE